MHTTISHREPPERVVRQPKVADQTVHDFVPIDTVFVRVGDPQRWYIMRPAPGTEPTPAALHDLLTAVWARDLDKDKPIVWCDGPDDPNWLYAIALVIVDHADRMIWKRDHWVGDYSERDGYAP